MGQGVNHFSRGAAVVQWPSKSLFGRFIMFKTIWVFLPRKVAVGQKRVVDVGKITKKREEIDSTSCIKIFVPGMELEFTKNDITSVQVKCCFMTKTKHCQRKCYVVSIFNITRLWKNVKSRFVPPEKRLWKKENTPSIPQSPPLRPSS